MLHIVAADVLCISPACWQCLYLYLRCVNTKLAVCYSWKTGVAPHWERQHFSMGILDITVSERKNTNFLTCMRQRQTSNVYS